MISLLEVKSQLVNSPYKYVTPPALLLQTTSTH